MFIYGVMALGRVLEPVIKKAIAIGKFYAETP